MRMSGRLLKAAVVGLVGALGIGAIVLLGFAVTRLHVDCTGLGAQECTFEQQLASSIARQQALAALGLGTLAAGLFLFIRRRAA